MRRFFLSAALAFALFAVVAPGARSIAQFGSTCHPVPDPIVTRIVDLGAFGGHESIAIAINNRQEVAGFAITTGTSVDIVAFLWNARDGMVEIGQGVPSDINDRGIVVGSRWFGTPTLHTRAFRWSAAEGMRELPGLGGLWTVANGINKRGDIVGWSQTPSGAARGVLWAHDGRVVDLGNQVVATSISDNGIVAGRVPIGGQLHAFTWTEQTQLIDLGPGYGTDVNRQGIVVGVLPGEDEDHVATALMWTAGASPLSLFGGNAQAINRFNVVAGTRFFDNRTNEDDYVAAVWTKKTGVRSLGTLGGCNSFATDINDRGDVVGASAPRLGVDHATMWQVRLAGR